MRKKSGVKPKFAVVLALAIVLVLIWYGYKADWFKNTNDDSVAATSQALNTLSVSQLQAILASLQAQLNALIAQLNQLQQQENNSKPIVKPIESIKPSIRVTSPNGGENWQLGSTQIIRWKSYVPCGSLPNSGACAEPTAYISVYEYAPPCVPGTACIAGMKVPYTIAKVRANIGSYNWAVGKNVDGLTMRPGNYLVQICFNNVCDQSDNYFTITNLETPSRAGTINVRVLKGGIYCIKAPCEFPLAGATVALYDQNKVLVGNQVVGADGFATFTGLNPGTYTAISRATGYVNTTNTIGVLAGQSVSIKTILMISPAPTSQLKASSELASVLQSLQGVLRGLSGALTP